MDELSLSVQSLDRVRLVIGASNFRYWVKDSSGIFSVKSFYGSFFPNNIFLNSHFFVSFGNCRSHRRYKFFHGLQCKENSQHVRLCKNVGPHVLFALIGVSYVGGMWKHRITFYPLLIHDISLAKNFGRN